MSGGSYEYLCFKEPSDLFHVEETIQRMADDLARLGYADDAAKETMSLLLEIRVSRIRLQSHLDRIKDVWQAVEWWRSCDSSEDSVKEALKKYRRGNQ